MIEWCDPRERLPEDGQECLLMPHDEGGMLTIGVFGPIAWSTASACWIDLFRDPEAGALVKPDQVGRWTLWEPIAPPRAPAEVECL